MFIVQKKQIILNIYKMKNYINKNTIEKNILANC